MTGRISGRRFRVMQPDSKQFRKNRPPFFPPTAPTGFCSIHSTSRTTRPANWVPRNWTGSDANSRRARKSRRIVVCHHPLDITGLLGLKDSAALEELLVRHRQVKAFIFGHTHDWHVETQSGGVQFINLPPTGYVFQPAAQRLGARHARARRHGSGVALAGSKIPRPCEGSAAELASVINRKIDTMKQTILFGLLLATALPLRAEPVDGNAEIRAGTNESAIVITTTRRLAGAIDSLQWHGREFINSTDHGRQLQSAGFFDNTPEANAETFNPTEAGSRDDGAGTDSTSPLLELVASGNHLRTRTQMAFWLAPGERSGGQLARNTNTLSNYVLTKDVTIGFERWPQALDYRVTFSVPAWRTSCIGAVRGADGIHAAGVQQFLGIQSGYGQIAAIERRSWRNK